jgi:hypothetical protein
MSFLVDDDRDSRKRYLRPHSDGAGVAKVGVHRFGAEAAENNLSARPEDLRVPGGLTGTGGQGAIPCGEWVT